MVKEIYFIRIIQFFVSFSIGLTAAAIFSFFGLVKDKKLLYGIWILFGAVFFVLFVFPVSDIPILDEALSYVMSVLFAAFLGACTVIISIFYGLISRKEKVKIIAVFLGVTFLLLTLFTISSGSV